MGAACERQASGHEVCQWLGRCELRELGIELLDHLLDLRGECDGLEFVQGSSRRDGRSPCALLAGVHRANVARAASSPRRHKFVAEEVDEQSPLTKLSYKQRRLTSFHLLRSLLSLSLRRGARSTGPGVAAAQRGRSSSPFLAHRSTAPHKLERSNGTGDGTSPDTAPPYARFPRLARRGVGEELRRPPVGSTVHPFVAVAPTRGSRRAFGPGIPPICASAFGFRLAMAAILVLAS